MASTRIEYFLNALRFIQTEKKKRFCWNKKPRRKYVHYFLFSTVTHTHISMHHAVNQPICSKPHSQTLGIGKNVGNEMQSSSSSFLIFFPVTLFLCQRKRQSFVKHGGVGFGFLLFIALLFCHSLGN